MAGNPATPRPLRVLFIGNSYTYYNNMPELFSKLAETGKAGVGEVRMVAPGGYRLKDHWKEGDALRTLHEGRWHYVVLQDQSTLGVEQWIEGKRHVTSDEVFRPYAEKWAAEIRKSGAVLVFFLTWAGIDTPEDQPALNYAYTSAARETQGRVAPVGVAWERVRQQWPSVNLFSIGRGSHPSPEGSYLAACTIYATIFQKSPVGMPARIEGTPVNLDTAKVEAGKETVLVDLPPGVATALQTAAWDAFEEQRKSGGYLKVKPVPPPKLPPLPVGAPLSPEVLKGTWTGKILFYPEGPVEMTLQLYGEQEGHAHLQMQYNSRDLADESLNVAHFHLGYDEFTFSDPRSSGVANLPVRFRCVLAQDGRLHGMAESVITDQTPPVRLIGDFVLEKH